MNSGGGRRVEHLSLKSHKSAIQGGVEPRR